MNRTLFAAVLLLSPTAHAADLMPAAQQNAAVKKYCGTCHSDARMYGGLSVEHFDAANPEPAVAAMLVSKITSGHTPREVLAAAQTGNTQSIVTLAKRGAITAASAAMPDEPTLLAFVNALSTEAAGADQWDSRWTGKTLTTSTLRALTSTKFPGATDMYRLILTCRTDTHEGEIKLAWANGVPEEGQSITVAVDGNAPIAHKVEGGKKQGNGVNGPGATILYPDIQSLPLPTRSLAISNLFPNETAVFPFDNLSATVRQNLSACFRP